MEMMEMTSTNGAAAEPSTSDSQPQMSGTTISFQSIKYKVLVIREWHIFTNAFWKQKHWRKTLRTVLDDVNGIMNPGLHAIMGPTGGGKTSLLDVLAGRGYAPGLSGEVLFNGAARPENFKFMSGYVVQNNMLIDHLTVRENLMFSAQLRLKRELTLAQKKEKVEEIIQLLELGNVAETRVMCPNTNRGISGGENKRANIGMELITNPSVLFLDEPTSGLDASTAKSLLLELKRMAADGHTIVVSIHQPRYSIFQLFDSLSLLIRGKMVYHGPATGALRHFTNAGYTCESFNNPADFFLDVITGFLKPPILNDSNSAEEEPDPGAQKENIVQNLVQDYENSEHYNKTKEALQRIHRNRMEKSTETLNRDEGFFARFFWMFFRFCSIFRCEKETELMTYNSSFYTQFKVVFWKSCYQLFWIKKTQILFLPMSLLLSRLVSTLFLTFFIVSLYNSKQHNQQGIMSRFGVFMIITLNQLYGGMMAAEYFITERRRYNHQYSSGYYRVSSYFLGKSLSDLVTARILPVFSFLFFFCGGLKNAPEAILLFLLIMILISFAGATMSLACTIAENNVGAIMQLMNVIVLGMTLYSGVLVNITFAHKWIDALKYLSIAYYGCTALQINEFKGLTFTVNTTGAVFNRTGEEILLEQGIEDLSPWGFWKNIVALIWINIWSLVIAYIRLRFLKELRGSYKSPQWIKVILAFGVLVGGLYAMAYCS